MDYQPSYYDRQNRFYQRMSTPWGAIQTYTQIAEGVVSVSTAGHGGIWLSDERIKELPDHYEPFTGTRRWAEEDEDGALVLQYLGLLSLIPEPLELHITEADIEAGRKSRKSGYGEPRYGGAIAEAYQRQTGKRYLEMICVSGTLQPSPGGFLLSKLPAEATAWMERFDAGEAVEPMSFVLEPYIVYERKTFLHHSKTGEAWEDRVSGYEANQILSGDAEALADYVDFKESLYPKFKQIVKITHEDTVLWQRA